MPLDLAKLKCVRRIGDLTRAQCPACAEAGGDTKGEHLSIFASGRFGCAVYPGDHPHRSRISAFAGDGSKIPPTSIKCRPVVLRQKWKSPDGSDGYKPVLQSYTTNQFPNTYGKMPSESSENRVGVEGVTGRTAKDPSEPSEKPGDETRPIPPATPPRPPLIPTEAPWQDGARYREAGAWENAAPHFECYIADPAGPWIRRHGVLLAVTPRYVGFAAP